MRSADRLLLMSFIWAACVKYAAAEMKNVPVCLLDNICADVPQDLVVNFPNKIIIYFYSGTTAYDYETFPLSNITDVLQHPRYDLSRRTLLYLHGFTETPMKESVVTVVTAHLQRGDHNVLSVDWSEVCNRTYREAAVLAPLTGLHVARGLDALVRAGQPLSHVHVVGHSLGGQCAGHVGKALTVGRLPRITALDPARPLFEGVGSPHLQREDARAVVVIHSDGGFYGVRAPTGTVDFFPNGGSRYQPGCSPAPDACAGDASTLPTKQFNQISAATRTRGASTRRRCWTSGATRPRRAPAGSTSSGGSARPRPPPSPTWASPTPAGQREHIFSLLYLRKG